MGLGDVLLGIVAVFIIATVMYYGNRYMLRYPYAVSSYLTMFAFNIIMLRLLAADLYYVHYSTLALSFDELVALALIVVLLSAVVVVLSLIWMGYPIPAIISAPIITIVVAVFVVWLFFLGGILLTSLLAERIMWLLCYVFTAFINPATIILAMIFAVLLVIYMILKAAGEEYYRYYLSRANWEFAKATGVFLAIQAVNLVLPFCIS
jgi:hypothetical protein